MRTRICVTGSAIALLLTLTAAPARAAIIDLTPTGFSFSACGVCDTFGGRGVYLEANSTFSIDEIGLSARWQRGLHPEH